MFNTKAGELPLYMSAKERKAVSIITVESDPALRNNMRQTLHRLGFGTVTDSPDHAQALQKFEQRKFTHVIFEAKKTNLPSKDFLQTVLDYDSTVIAIPSSYEPTVDDVFGLLCLGARGYLVKPFTESTVEDAIVMATKGEPISDSILYAKDRNQALSALVLTALDKVAILMRQSGQFETARRELPHARAVFFRTMDIAKTFAKGGDAELLYAMIELCLERSSGPATMLGRMRRRHESKRSSPGTPTLSQE
jgi:ActR/RegA family two-component response regulator